MKKDKDITLCKSLDEVRLNIDRIDERLILLMTERSCYVNQASQFKNTTSDVVSTNRVNAVIEKVRGLAKEAGLNPSIAEKVYRTMIKAFTEEELIAFDSKYKEIKQSYY